MSKGSENKMELDIFGVKIGGNELTGTKKLVEYEITKEQLLNKLGFKSKNVTYISYDYNKGILTIKVKE